MASLWRMLPSCMRSRLGLRLMLLLWLVIVLALISTRFVGRGCRKRVFAYRDQLEESTHAVATVLDELGLRFFLCYGSLWGQVHERRNPPWEADAELCVLSEQDDSAADRLQDRLVMALDAAGFLAEQDGRLGRYDVYRTDGTPGLVQIVFFAPDAANKMYRRDGWMHRSHPAVCTGDTADPQLHCFPARLVAAPLERRPFGAHHLPVPWLGFEIQKYLFPNTWFRDYAPIC
ncbi:uncharacterized protein LOC122363380 isoform X2 [Amphibalanus amphitrite]|nr:uncharacterized protein LOC122363380 isoform X2 [Amphibalanus amphitrite]XP_043188522.1 uncharacterized protein LOC122363380 isoform X2 [Amphibalanus amphitrite]